jgi:peptidoglycan/xylan/chitin deacetylase (PgdA/CDA1 family)
MGIADKTFNRIARFYRQSIVKEQYPMLTSFSRRKLMRDGALGLVYMLHHVCEKDARLIPTNEELKVSPAFLEEIILRYKRLGFDFISLDQLNEMIRSGESNRTPFVAFTIDDGYLDNFTNALPVFEKYDVPFAIFVATDFIDKKAILWWDSIEELIMTHDIITTDDGKTYMCNTFLERWNAFRYLRERILNLDQNYLEQGLNEMFASYCIDWYDPIKKKGMTWSQIKELASHPLCTIGGHTVSHPALNKLSEKEVIQEVKDGMERIGQVIQEPVRYFAYPYGTLHEIGEREFCIIEEMGIQLAFMAHQGCITINNMKNVTRMPRVYLKE